MGVNGIYGLSGSGLDIESMVKMSKQSQYDKMYKTETKMSWQKEAYSTVYTDLTNFGMNKLTDYKLQSKMNAMAATSNNTSAFTVSANGSAVAMSHRVELPPILTEDERNSVIASAMPGSLLFQPGQVSVLLGTTHEGKPMVLQALYQCGASGLNGTEMQYPCRVLLSSLALLGDDGRTFCKRITSVGTMIP